MDLIKSKNALLESVLGQVGSKDPNLLVDIINYSQPDVPHLIKRISKQQSDITGRDFTQKWIDQFIKAVVACYILCVDSLKLSRKVFQLIQPWIVTQKEKINAEFEAFIKGVILSKENSRHELTAVSYMLESNEFIRPIFQELSAEVLEWLNFRLNCLFDINNTTLHVQDTEKQHMYVRIILQLYQFCPACFASPVFDDSEEDRGPACRNIFDYLLLVLTNDNFTTDCKLLSGTAISLVLTKLSNKDQAIGKFWNLFMQLGKGKKPETRLTTENITNSIPKDDKAKDHNMGHISLMKGILSSGQLLLQNTTFIIQCFQEIIKFCLSNISLHYHAFNTLEQLLTKVHQNLPIMTSADISHVLSFIIPVTIETVFLNWDSPVQDVPQTIVRVFSLVMHIWQHGQKLSCCDDIVPDLLSRIQSVPWYVKGQYRIISALIPFIEIEQLISNGISCRVLKCMSTNYLASCGSDVYKAFLLKISSQESSVEIWTSVWKNTVISGITSHDRLLRINVGHFIVPSTLKIIPEAKDILLSSLMSMLSENSTRNQALYGWVTVSQAVRLYMGEMPSNVTVLQEALYSNDDDIRSQAFSVLCSSLKTAERLRGDEDRLLRECLPYNLKIDSAPFRQQLSSNVKKLLTRIRESYKAMVKDKDNGSIDRSIGFVEWLYKIYIDNLIPGGCFQRTKMCLELVQVMLEVFFPISSDLPLITKEAQTRKLWDVYTEESTQSVLYCLLDGADEIQNLACSLLMQYFKWPPAENFVEMLLSSAFTLCDRPKQHENQSGVLLCVIVFVKYVLNLNWHFSWMYENGRYTIISSEKGGNLSAVKFLMSMLNHIHQSFQEAKARPVSSSVTLPLHGFNRALTSCLNELSSRQPLLELNDIIQRFVDLNCSMITYFMEMMSKESSDGACPSFAELGQAMESMIIESDTQYSESTTVSAEHQFLLTWCWINVKECCRSLSSLCHNMLSLDSDINIKDIIQKIEDVFKHVLTKCRHRGVIEGCRASFIQFIGHLFSSSCNEINCIPKRILEQAFIGFSTSAISSVTRRSAGLPLIIQAVVTVERKFKQNHLLKFSLESLFRLSSEPLPSQYSDQHDLPQVHGINILTTLLGDSSLSAALMSYTSKAVVLVIESFESPAWSVRNAATMLFSALVMRMFGQKKNCVDDVWRGVSVVEFTSLYPELLPLITSCIDKALQDDITKLDNIRPSLFPALTLLSYLGPVDTLIDVKFIELGEKILRLLSSPVLYLRNLAASAYVAFVPLDCRMEKIKETGDHLKHAKTNQMHGILLFLQKLSLQSLSPRQLQSLKEVLFSHKFISYSPCDVIRAKYLQLLRSLCWDSPQDIHTLSEIETQSSLSDKVQVFDSLSIEEKIMIHLKDLILNELDIDLFLSENITLNDVLKSSICVECIYKNFDSLGGKTLGQVQIHLSMLLETGKTTYYPLLLRVLHLIVKIHNKVESSDTVVEHLHRYWTGEKHSVENFVNSQNIVIGAICIENFINNTRYDKDKLENWCVSVFNSSQKIGAEHYKVAAGHCLKIAGHKVIAMAENDTHLHQSALLLIRSALNLIEDEDSDIRSMVVDFISSLQWKSKPSQFTNVLFNKGTLMLYDLIECNFWNSDHIMKGLHQVLYSAGDIQKVYECKIRNRQRQLFEKEDENFFSEKIINHCHIHSTLMRMLVLYKEKRPTLLDGSISSDLKYLSTVINQTKDDGYFTPFADGQFLNIAAGLLLSVHFLTVMSVEGTATETSDLIYSILQSSRLPASFRNMVMTEINYRIKE